MDLQENIQRIKEVMMIKENKLGNPINSSVLEIPKINDKVSQKK